MKIYIGADHAGFELKEELKAYISSLGCELIDEGPSKFDEDDDYPDFIRPVAVAVSQDIGSLGIILGGSGQGEAMCANRIKGARAAVFYGGANAKQAIDIEGTMSTDPYEIIRLAREHNNANILSLGMRFLTKSEVEEAIKIFLETKFSGKLRHVRRIDKLDIY